MLQTYPLHHENNSFIKTDPLGWHDLCTFNTLILLHVTGYYVCRLHDTKNILKNSKGTVLYSSITNNPTFSDDESRQRLTGNPSFSKSHNGVRRPMTVKDQRVRDQTGDAREARKQVKPDTLSKTCKNSHYLLL